MKKFSFYMVLLFTLFIPKVYAFTYDIDTKVVDTSVNEGAEVEIKVSLTNIQGTDDGIASCSLNLAFDGDVLLNSKVRTLGSWTMTTGKIYLFDTGAPVVSEGEIFVIPVKVNGMGTVKLTDIKCSDGNTNAFVSDKNVSFTIDNGADQEEISGEEPGSEVSGSSSNCDLSNIRLSEGTITFDSAVTEYSLKVTNFDDLVIEPELADENSTFNMVKEDNTVFITVTAVDGTKKRYTLFVEIVSSSEMPKEQNDKNNNYIPIFIAIICVLVLINIIRIIKTKKNK